MQKINVNVDEIVNYKPQEYQFSDADVDKVTNWHKVLEGVYNVRPLPPAGLIAWVNTLGHCDNQIMGQIIKGWVAEEPQAPKPADLTRLYRQYRDNMRSEESRRRKELGIDEDCPYCYGTKWIRLYRGKEEGVVPCSCQQTGYLKILLTDGKWEWVDSKRGFVMKWIKESEE